MDARCTVLLVGTLLTGTIAAQDSTSCELCDAASRGDLGQVKALIASGAKPDVRGQEGETPLHSAVALRARLSRGRTTEPDYAGVINYLLDRGANPNAKDDAGRTPLLRAMEGTASEYTVRGADEADVRQLIAHGASVNLQDKQGWSPLLKLTELWADQIELMRFLISKGAAVNARTQEGTTSLMLAARLGKDDRVKLLLDRGANINAQDSQGRNALMEAVTGRLDPDNMVARLLLARGANINAADRSRRTAVEQAAAEGHPERVKLLLDRSARVKDSAALMREARNRALLRALKDTNGTAPGPLLDEGASPDYHDEKGRTALMIALANDVNGVIPLFLAKGANVNVTDATGVTPLMIAAERYNAANVQLLLDHGADPNARDRRGITALLAAAASRRSYDEKQEALIPSLLAKGADPRARTAKGVTALMLTAAEGNSALLDLLEKGAPADDRDEDGNTALLYAARFFVRGDPRLAGGALLDAKADVNAANHAGETALMLAATQYEVDGIKLLLDRGANINARDVRGRAALMWAIDGPQEFDNQNHVVYSPAIADLLIARGADLNARDADGNTALSLASKRGYASMAQRLREHGVKN